MKKPITMLTTTVLATLFLVVLAAPSLAQYAGGAQACGVDDTTLVPGQTITVTGSGYPANSQVTITLSPGGIELGTATTDDQGSFSQTGVFLTNSGTIRSSST